MRRAVLAVRARVMATATCMLLSPAVCTRAQSTSASSNDNGDDVAAVDAPVAEAAMATTTTTTTASPAHATTTTMSPSVVSAAPHRRVGNIFIVTCADHPFKHGWEVNNMLRSLRLEFMGQTVIVADVPSVRKQLWRVRHVVRIDMLDLDEAKALIGVPEHVTFRDLQQQLTPLFGRVRGTASPHLRSKMNFMRYRRMRLRDVLHRDMVEKQLLEERRKLLQQQQQQQGQDNGGSAVDTARAQGDA